MVFWSSVDIIGWELCFLFVLVQAELIDHVARSDRLCLPTLFQTLSQFHFWGEQPFYGVLTRVSFPNFREMIMLKVHIFGTTIYRYLLKRHFQHRYSCIPFVVSRVSHSSEGEASTYLSFVLVCLSDRWTLIFCVCL